MDRNKDYEASFLEDAAEQIAYKPLRPSIVQELRDHIEDRAEEYEAGGLCPADARKKAVEAMGDGVAVGAGINAVRCVRHNGLLTILTVLLMLFGLAGAAYMSWSPEQQSNGFLYYLPGTALLIFTAYKGYPWLVRYQKKLLTLASLLILWEAAYSLLSRRSLLPVSILRTGIFVPVYMIGYYATLLLGPVLVIAIYRLRARAFKAMAAAILVPAAAVMFRFDIGYTFKLAAMAVFLISMMGTLLFMIHRGIIKGAKPRLYAVAGAGGILVMGLFSRVPFQHTSWQAFTAPGAHAASVWEDAYNGVLIQDLLARTPLTGGISLTQEELMSYGTGEWYYGSTDGLPYYQIKDREKTGTLRGYIHYDESDVTLWDILPQHYHNNYLIAVLILLCGWLPGLLLLGAIAAFYILIFSRIRKIHGALAGAVSLYCGLCLMLQSLLYVLGNFGFQYSTFTNLPLISEGRLSIMVNMLLLGFIFSAYRYDRVIDMPAADRSGPYMA